MRPPAFWSNPPEAPGTLARLLAPLAAAYATATRMRAGREGRRFDRPVICVGNINAGGAGKTPVVIALAERLAQRVTVHVVSRGYGGSATGPLRVDETRHDAGEVGDEPLLLSAFAPTWVSRDRAAGVAAAIADGAEVVILDDGFQNGSVVKDASLVVVDAGVGFGNGRVIPAGPLREPVAAGLARADALVVVGPSDHRARFLDTLTAPPPVIEAELAPLQTGMDWSDMRVLAFAGIGRPEKFFATLRDLGAELVGTVALNDHQPLDRRLMQRLISDATRLGAQLVCTEKDAVRLPPELRSQVLPLPVRLEFVDPAMLDEILRKAGI